MYIDLVHTQPLFREAPDTLVVKYTHPDTGVNLEIPYDDLVNTVVAVSALLEGEEVEEQQQEEVTYPAMLSPEESREVLIEDQVTAGVPSGLRVMRSHIPDGDV
jgi:hypothetical protein